ncbi:MAG: hypothetical protein AAF791_04600 [Bacteroidota bacterium]
MDAWTHRGGAHRGGRPSRGRWSVVGGLLLVVLALLAAAPRAQQVRLHVLADTVALGEAFEVALAADHAPSVQTVFPEVPRDRTAESGPLLMLGGVEATDVQRFAPEVREGLRTDSVVYRALAFAADSARVGPVEVAFVTDGDTIRVSSPSALVRVRSLVPGAEAEPEPPAPPLPFPSPVPVWIALGVLGAALTGLAIWGGLRLLRRDRTASAPYRLGPHPQVTARLDALADDLPTSETAQAWLFALADALRTYVERRLRVPARERTTREVDAALASRLPDPPRRTLRNVLRVCDRGKFADLRPGTEAAREVLGYAREAVDAIEAHVAGREAAAKEAERETPSV